jgi:hypothetical protein|tara:strand:+ start:820 stop:1167 length:348 start_codon:yes stop_codon:yes gene_type:complete
MVNPLNSPYSPENINHRTEFENGTAIGMPPINFGERKNTPVSNINSLNTYSPEHNPIRRYNKNLAPSSVLTEAFFKSRILSNPVYMHNEAATRYQMISKVFFSSDDIKTNLLRVA